MLNRLPVSKRLQAALQAVASEGMHVGLVTIPRHVEHVGGVSTPVDYDPPYWILTPLPTVLSGPPLGRNRHADATWGFQISAYSKRGDQVEWMQDRVRQMVFAMNANGEYVTNLDVPGLKIIDRELTDDMGVGEPAGGIVPADLRIALTATPA